MPEAVVDYIGGKRLRRRHPPQAPQVEYLHAVRAGIVGDDVSMVLIDLDVPPGGIPGFCRQPSKEDRALRVGNVNEGGTVVHAHQGELFTGLPI